MRTRWPHKVLDQWEPFLRKLPTINGIEVPASYRKSGYWVAHRLGIRLITAKTDDGRVLAWRLPDGVTVQKSLPRNKKPENTEP